MFLAPGVQSWWGGLFQSLAIARPLRGSVQNALGAQETGFRIRLLGGADSKVTPELRWTSKQGQLNKGLNV